MQHYTKVANGISAYIINDLAKPFAGSPQSWVFQLAAGVIQERANVILPKLMDSNWLQIPCVSNGDMIDVELLYKLLVPIAQAEKMTIKLPFVGPVTFGVDDVHAIHRYINGG